jgi:hypothetical protein
MKRVLFVAYGSGHIKMVVPVAQALKASGLAQPLVLALTTAAPVAREAGLDVVQFKDFATPADEPALAQGRRLMSSLGGTIADTQETEAYLGLSYQELVDTLGSVRAEAEYQQRGRQAFLPVQFLERILKRLSPQLVVATNSPRAERAAILAARRLEIPAVCLVDLFAIDEVQWIGAADYADRVCVLNDSVRDFLIASGRSDEQVVVTGNPGFDNINCIQTRKAGERLRAEQGWGDKDVVLWAPQPEPLSHPSRPGQIGDPTLPPRIFSSLLAWVARGEKRVLLVRSHPSEPDAPNIPVAQAHLNGQQLRNGREFELHPLLHSVNAVVTMNSTVGLEAFLAGRPVIQVLGSLFDTAVPLSQFGMAIACASPEMLSSALDRALRNIACTPKRSVDLGCPDESSATQRVMEIIKELLL